MSTVAQEHELLTEKEVAAYLRMGRSTLAGWRASGVGPKVTKLGGTAVRYKRTDLMAWIASADDKEAE